MSLIPETPPGIESATPQLEREWQRCRRRLSIAFRWLPAMHAGVCLTLLAIAMARTTPAAWWILPLLGSVLPYAAQLGWLARSGLTDPPSWGKAAILTGGCQIVLGLIPSMSVAYATGENSGAVAAVFGLGWLLFVASCVLGIKACRGLYGNITPELGSTPFRIELGARFAMARASSASCSILLELDHVSWSARTLPKRPERPAEEMSLRLADLREITPVTLPPGPPLQWFALHDGTPLYAEQGPAVVLRTGTGEYILPVHDAGLASELLHRRVARSRATTA